MWERSVDGRDHIRTPRANVLCDLLHTLDHDHLTDLCLSLTYRLSGLLTHIRARLEKGICAVDKPLWSLVPADSSSSTDASPPAPHLLPIRRQVVCVQDRSKCIHCMPTSGLGFKPCDAVSSTSAAQSSVGIDKKPDESSSTSKPRSLHLRRYPVRTSLFPAEAAKTHST